MNMPNAFLNASFLMLLSTHVLALQHNENRWDGFYMGGDVGSVQSKTKTHSLVAPGGTYFNYTADAPQIVAAGDHRLSNWHFSAGVFGGYNYQINNVLTGIEASINRTSIKNSVSTTENYFSDPTFQFTFSHALQSHWQETLRLRLGLVQNCWLAYFTGGAAMTHIKYISSLKDNNTQAGSGLPGAQANGQTTKTKFGWNLGAGAEYALNDTWAIKAEYLYIDFGKVRTNYNLIPSPMLSEFSSSLKDTAEFVTQSMLVGIIYRL